MALTVVPDPVLDSRDEDEVAAESVGSLPQELSDRSDSNPAVVMLEAAAFIYGRLSYQINRWPRSVITKVLALIGITLKSATAATVTQTFTLSQPRPRDSTIATGALVATTDGATVFATTADATIAAYTIKTGTLSTTSGSTAVVGVGTTFLSQVSAGWQISLDGTTWLTVASVTNDLALVLSSSAPSTVAGSAYYAGPISTTVAAQCTSTGSTTNVGAATITVLQSSSPGVSTTTNAAGATGGTDDESLEDAIARAATEFAQRDVCVQVEDYAAFAMRAMGSGSRAKASANMNVTTATTGYVSVALLSQDWTVAAPVSTLKRAAVMRDFNKRTQVGTNTVDLAANVQTITPALLVIRKAAFDATSVRVNIAAAINTYLDPDTYPWGRTIYPTDLADIAEGAEGVDRVYAINGVVGAGAVYNAATPAPIAFVLGNTLALTASTVGIFAGRTWIIDTVNSAAYLVTAVDPNVSVTFDRAFEGASVTIARPYFLAQDYALTNWYSLAYSSLSVVATAPAASIVVVGSQS